MVRLFILSTVMLSLFGLQPIDNVKVTGYCPGPPCVHPKWADGITAAGTPARYGVCAADWEVFPKGSLFEVEGYGRCRVEDTGNAVRGKHLDLYFDTAEQAKEWGVKNMRVHYVGQEEL